MYRTTLPSPQTLYALISVCTCIDPEIFLRGRVFSVSLRCEFNRLCRGEIPDPSRSAHVAIQESNLLLLCTNQIAAFSPCGDFLLI